MRDKLSVKPQYVRNIRYYISRYLLGGMYYVPNVPNLNLPHHWYLLQLHNVVLYSVHSPAFSMGW